MTDVRKYILFLVMLGLVLILQYSAFLVGMDMLPGYQNAPPEDTNGSVQIVSEPEGSGIFFDGINTGQNTPFYLMDIHPGNYNVTVTLAGYKTQSEHFEVFSGDTTYVRFILEPINVTQGSPVPVQQPAESDPPFGGEVQPDDSPLPSYASVPRPVSIPAPEFPSPVIPAAMVIGCIGVVLMVARWRD